MGGNPVSTAINGLDHAIIAVSDLEAARSRFEALGFTCAPLGNHVGKATANHCIMFPDSYLELVGINEPDNPDTLDLAGFFASRGEGLVQVALATPDADAARAEIEVRGFAPTGPDDLARPLEDPPGAMVRFRNLQIPHHETGGLGTFLCGHTTPALMRPAGSTQHPNGARNLVAALAIADNLEAVSGPWSRLLGRAASRPDTGTAILDAGRGEVLVTSPDDRARDHRIADLIPTASLSAALPARPFWCSIRIEVASIDALRDSLGGIGAVIAETGPDWLRITECGVHIAFTGPSRAYDRAVWS